MKREQQAAETTRTPEETKRSRSKAMITLGSVAAIWGFVMLAIGGNIGALLFGVLGVGLLVGGLVIRP